MGRHRTFRCLTREPPNCNLIAGIVATDGSGPTRRSRDVPADGKYRNLGNYIKKLDELEAGDEKVRATLRQIKDLHRNTLVHPEDVLTMDEAINLLGIIRSAVAAMLKAIPAPSLVLTPD